MAWKQMVITVSAAALVAGIAAMTPSEVQARGRHHGGRVVIGGVYGVGPYFGLGWGWRYSPFFYGPYWDPYYHAYGYRYGAVGGVDPNVAMMAGVGAVDVNVKPNRAEVWVDGKYYAEARDLDGEPSLLWLKEGEHTLSIRKGGYATFETKVDIRRGIVRELKVRLHEAESEAPAHSAAEVS